MAIGTVSAAGADSAAVLRRKALAGPSGPAGLVQNAKVFGMALFACLGGYDDHEIDHFFENSNTDFDEFRLLYGYNQGVFSGVCKCITF